MKTVEVKYQACNLVYALLRNINDNFESVSFAILGDGDIQVKIVLSKLTEEEEELVDDLGAEFSALQDRNCVLKTIVEVRRLQDRLEVEKPTVVQKIARIFKGNVGDYLPLEHLVYQKGGAYRLTELVEPNAENPREV